MNTRHWLGLFAICITNTALAQPPQQPGMLPTTLSGQPRIPLTTKPRNPDQERADAIKTLREDIVSFEAGTINVRRVDGRWLILSNKGTLRDFGTDRTSAEEMARLLIDLKVNEIGSVPGARPSLEYWLVDGKTPRPITDRRVIVPVTAKSLRAENVGGAWVLTDGARAFYDFGASEEAAKQAVAIFWKYGFNQLGLIGSPNPVVWYPLHDPTQVAREQKLPTFVSSPLQVASDVSRSSLLLPGNVYGGPRAPLDLKAVEIVRHEFQYYLVHGKETWARFGSSEYEGRMLLKILQDAKVDEIIRLGEFGFPLFLAQGQVVRARPLGVTTSTVRLERMKIQKLRDTWWLFEDTRPVLECGTKKDAEIMLLTMQQYGLDTFSTFGRPDGGLKLLTKSR